MDSADLGGPEPKGMDADERREMVVDRRQMLKRAGLGAAALTIPASVMATPSMGSVADALAADSFIKSHPKWKFNFVNHVTTNPFFVPTIYGAQDACSLLGTSYQWTGSQTSDISQMVNAMNAAITAKADGISVCLVSLTAFNGPTNRALGRGIPVLSYNADAPNKRLAYIGQDLYLSGYNMGQRIVELVRERRSGTLHRNAGPAQHPAADRRRDRRDQEVRQGQDQDDHDGHRRAPPRRVGEDRGLLPRSQEPQGDVRRRLRLDAGRRPGHAEVRPREEGRSRPEATTSGRPSSRLSKRATWTSRSTSSPTCRVGSPSSSSSSTSTRQASLHRPTRTPESLFVTKANVNPYLTTKTRYEGSSSKQKYPVTQKG